MGRGFWRDVWDVEEVEGGRGVCGVYLVRLEKSTCNSRTKKSIRGTRMNARAHDTSRTNSMKDNLGAKAAQKETPKVPRTRHNHNHNHNASGQQIKQLCFIRS